MPTYSFRCRKCDQPVLAAYGFREPHPSTHDGCGGELERRFSDFNVVHRGSGFYSVDKRLTPVKPIDYHPDED